MDDFAVSAALTGTHDLRWTVPHGFLNRSGSARRPKMEKEPEGGSGSFSSSGFPVQGVRRGIRSARCLAIIKDLRHICQTVAIDNHDLIWRY
jgi:hypothetical protein